MRPVRVALLATTSLALLAGCPEEEGSPTNTGSVSGTLTFGVPPAGSGLFAPKSIADLPAGMAALGGRLGRPTPRVRTTRDGPALNAGEVLVRLPRADLPKSAVLETVRVDGYELTYRHKVIANWHLLGATRGGRRLTEAQTLELVARVGALPGVEIAEANRRAYPLALPSDGLYKYQWHYDKLQLPAAWDVTPGASSVVVAVVDTGIVSHPDLQARLVDGADFISDPAMSQDGDGRDNDPRDMGRDEPNGGSSWHGTHVAGTIGASTNNGQGVSGVDWNCRIQPVRVLGKGGGTLADIAQGMAWAVGKTIDGMRANATPAKVVNLSLGGDGAPSALYQEVIDYGVAQGAVFVVAAGNENENTSGKMPANQQNVVTVGSIAGTGVKASYSNFGAEVDVVAPGGEMIEDADGDGYPDGVLSTYASPTGAADYDYLQGTSMAAPHVAGVVALIKSVNATAPSAQIEAALKSTAVSAFQCTQGCGNGLVNAFAAVLQAKGSVPTGPAQLSVPSRTVTLVGTNKGAISVANVGGGTLTVAARASGENAQRVSFPTGASKTLGAAQAGTVDVQVDVAGLADGSYGANVDLDAGAAGSVAVRVNFKVGAVAKPRTTVVAAVYQDSAGEWQVGDGAELNPTASTAEYEIRGLAPRSYYVLAAVDDNGNGEFFEDGERFGFYENPENPVEVTVEVGQTTTGIDFALIAQGSAPGEDTRPVPVGAACTSTADCGAGGDCDQTMPGGYCYKECPNGAADCPAGSACFGSGASAVCLATCSSPYAGQDGCRSGYLCWGTSGSDNLCWPPCTFDGCSTGTCGSSGYCE